MEFDHILIRYGEIALKGNNRKFFLNKLEQNIRKKIKSFPKARVKQTQGRFFVLLNGHDPDPIVHKLKDVFGIHSLSLAIRTENELETIQEGALFALTSARHVETFKVQVRRADKSFPIGSQEMNQKLGAYLLKNSEGFSVDVHRPDLEVRVEIRNTGTYITSSIIKGLGGLPVGTGGRTLLLLSGGIDSPVAGYLVMKRGIQVDAIHFHSPPYTSERAKQKVIDLAKTLTKYGNQMRIFMVPFTELQQEIFKQIPDRYTMTVMRRVMVKIAEQVCQEENILSLATGESLGQVASQTMESMHVINEVTNYPILRPLIAMDKEEIVAIAEQIGTYPISILPYEDCCTIFMPKQPATNPTREKVNAFEEQADFTEQMKRAIEGIEVIEVKDEETELESEFEELL